MFSFLFIVVPEEEKLDGDNGDDGIEPSRRYKMQEQHKNAQLTIQASRTVKHIMRDKALKHDDNRDNDDRKKEATHIEPPLQIEAPKRMTEEQGHVFRFNVSRDVYVRNGVPYIISVDGDTYDSLASSNNLFVREVLKFNDLSKTERLLPGTVVYLQPKKAQGVKGLEKHVVEEGESMREISQRYGVKLAKLYKLNGMSANDVLHEGDIIKLRK